MEEQKYVRVSFALDEDADVESECLWATPNDDGSFTLGNVPLHIPGVAAGDAVTAEGGIDDLWATAVAHDGGHANLWVEVYDDYAGDAEELLDIFYQDLESLGCLCEIDTDIPRLAVDVIVNGNESEVVARLVAPDMRLNLDFEVSKTTTWMDDVIEKFQDKL